MLIRSLSVLDRTGVFSIVILSIYILAYLIIIDNVTIFQGPGPVVSASSKKNTKPSEKQGNKSVAFPGKEFGTNF